MIIKSSISEKNFTIDDLSTAKACKNEKAHGLMRFDRSYRIIRKIVSSGNFHHLENRITLQPVFPVFSDLPGLPFRSPGSFRPGNPSCCRVMRLLCFYDP